MKLNDNLKEWVKDIGFAVVFAIILLQFVQPTIVREHSMENTLHENDYLFVSKQSYRLFGGSPACGDIIVFRSSLSSGSGKGKLLIKRVIAVPGDTVSIHDGRVYRNGEELSEDYTKDGFTGGNMEEITVPEGSVFVMGDNRQNSADSRDSRIGPVDMDSIVGKAVFRLFPFSSIGGLD
ncbi:MAG TPA: signal peptidase I [Bacillota bacterium]|nr:signal peptidase I [Bacillota bacterium]